jgi:DNA polymerase III subunit beta
MMAEQIPLGVKTALDVLLPVAAFAAGERSVNDVYKHVLIKSDGNQCFAIASNGSQSLIRALPLPLLSEPFSVCMDGVKLRGILSGLKDASEQDMLISWSASSATIKVGRSKLTLAVIPASTYPSPERLGDDAATVVLPSGVILDALRSAIHACGENDVRHFLNGCFLRFDEQTLVVAGSDGHRLCRIVKTVNTSTSAQGILPKKFIDLLHQNAGKMGGDIRLRMNRNMVEATWSGGQLRSALIEGQYPDFTRFFDAKHTPLFTCSKQSILQSISRLRATVYEKLPSLSIESDGGELKLVTLDEHKIESGIDYLTAKIDSNGLKPLSINISYLSDCLNTISDDELNFSLAETGGVVIKSANNVDYLEIIQQLRR